MENRGLLRIAGRPLPVVGRARMYVCGITPYDTTHLGHAATFVWADQAVRVLRHVGVEVEVCRNITDVDDVLTDAAAQDGSPFESFAAVQQFNFERDMDTLNVRRPTHEPRAHNYIAQVSALAAALLAVGAAYPTDRGVYFRGGAALEASGLDRDEALRLAEQFGDRPDDPAKLDPLDVPVWRRSGPDEPAWPSRWGPGRPGWHAECAAMALSTFGSSLDLHGGGADLRFPHHAYEAAMAEAVSGVKPFARAWLHTGTVHVDGAKMAKSTGNLVLVGDMVAKYPASALRLAILDRPWSADWDYRPEDLDTAAARLDRLYTAAGRSTTDGAAEAAAVDTLLDDLGTRAALDIAEESGGTAARGVLGILGLR